MSSIETKIQTTAQRILAEQGYSALSMQYLAEETALGNEFYLHPFAQKNILFHTLVTKFYQNAAAEISAAFDTNLSLTDTLRQYIAAYLGYIDQHRQEACAVFEIMKNYCDLEGNSVYEPQKFTLYYPLIKILRDCPNLIFPASQMAQIVHCAAATIASELMHNRLENIEQVIARSAVLFDFVGKIPANDKTSDLF